MASAARSVVSSYMMGSRVVAMDVGSVRPPSRFAWAGFEAPVLDPVAEGSDPESAVDAVVTGLAGNGRAVLLVESPMAVPVPGTGGWLSLGKARRGEGNRPWSRAPGPVC